MNDSSRPRSGQPHKPAAGQGAAKVADSVAIVVADLVALGRDAIERGDVDAARRALGGATSRAPKNRDVMVLKALVLSAEDDPEAALDALDDAMERFPDDVAIVAHKAFILLDDIGDPEEALPLLQQALAALQAGGHDEDAGLDVELGLRVVDAQLALGDVPAAITAANTAIAAASGEEAALARSALARALMASGDLPAARAEADAAVAGCPDSADVHAVLGRVAITAGDDDTANRAFARAFALDAERGQPPRLTATDFKSAFDAVVAQLPQPLRGYVQKLPLSFEAHADVARLTALERSPETPFLVEGPLREAGRTDPFAHRPTAAVLYQGSVESLCRDIEELEDVIMAVVVEGVGMFLGLEFDEDLEHFADVAVDYGDGANDDDDSDAN